MNWKLVVDSTAPLVTCCRMLDVIDVSCSSRSRAFRNRGCGSAGRGVAGWFRVEVSRGWRFSAALLRDFDLSDAISSCPDRDAFVARLGHVPWVVRAVDMILRPAGRPVAPVCSGSGVLVRSRIWATSLAVLCTAGLAPLGGPVARAATAATATAGAAGGGLTFTDLGPIFPRHVNNSGVVVGDQIISGWPGPATEPGGLA